MRRIDTGIPVHCRSAAEEKLFAESEKELGLVSMRRFFVVYVPVLLWFLGVSSFAIIESLGAFRVLNDDFHRVQTAIAMAVPTIMAPCAYFLLQREFVSAGWYPFVAPIGALITHLEGLPVCWLLMRRLVGRKTGTGGSAIRMAFACMSIVVSRSLRLSVFATTFLVIMDAFTVEFFIMFILSRYEYSCSCYRTLGDVGGFTSVRFPPSFSSPPPCSQH